MDVKMAIKTAQLRLEGGPEVEAALRELGGKIARNLGRNAARAGARVVVNSAKAKTPVRTGELRDSIRMFDERFEQGANRTAYAGSRLFYAYWVEFGTARTPARSFLRAAKDESADAVREKMSDNLANGIEREMAKYRGR